MQSISNSVIYVLPLAEMTKVFSKTFYGAALGYSFYQLSCTLENHYNGNGRSILKPLILIGGAGIAFLTGGPLAAVTALGIIILCKLTLSPFRSIKINEVRCERDRKAGDYQIEVFFPNTKTLDGFKKTSFSVHPSTTIKELRVALHEAFNKPFISRMRLDFTLYYSQVIEIDEECEILWSIKLPRRIANIELKNGDAQIKEYLIKATDLKQLYSLTVVYARPQVHS